MSRQTEFTQKVLHDLRRRKEYMAMSQTPKDSNQNQTSADIYRKFKQASQGSKETNPYGSIGSTSHYVNGWYGNGQDSSFSIKESSKQIMPIGGSRARSSENIADLSMALAFALKNNGKHKRMGSSENSSTTFLHHIGKVDLVEVDRRSGLPSSGRFPTHSLLHIQEISNGAEKLNQILTGCYDGLNSDKFSVEIGHELLKGAMDLEESLRMLVNLQGFSENMVIPQRKQRTIRLVEVEKDPSHTTETVNKQMKSERPKLSFNKLSRNSAEDILQATKSNPIKQKQLTLYSPTEPQKINSAKQAPTTSSEIVSHRCSASCGEITNTITTLTNPNKHSRSDSQLKKGRLSNVVAKLMGLEEFPTPIQSKAGGLYDTAIKQESSVAYNSMKSLHKTTKKTIPETMHNDKLRLPTDEPKVLPTNNSETQFADRSLVRQNETSERVVHKEKSHPNEPKNAETLVREQEKKTRQNKRNMKEQKNTRNGDTKEKVFEDELHMPRQILKQPEPVFIKQEKAATKETMLQKERTNANDKLLTLTKQENPQQDIPRQPRYKLRKSESKNSKLQPAKEQMTVKRKPNPKNPEETETMQKVNASRSIHDIVDLQQKLINRNPATVRKNPDKPDDAIKRSIHEDLISQQNIIILQPKLRKPEKENFNHRIIPTDRDTDEEISKVEITTPVSIKLMQNKVEGTELLKIMPPRILNKELGSDSPGRQVMSLKQPASVLEEPEKRRHERNVAQVSIMLTREEEEEANIRSPISTEATHTIPRVTPSLSYSAAEEYQMLNEMQTINTTAKIQKTTEVSKPLQASVVLLSKDQPFKSTDSSIQIKALQESSIIDVAKPLQQERPKSEILGSPPANEDHLKQILLRSRVFLNAAVALFRFQFPVGTLHCSTNKFQDEDSKLLLDSGYETMRRKGKIQELNCNPCIGISVGSKKVRCLDSLVKKLNEDLETYKYSANEHIEDEASHLHYLLQKDIENKNPVVNCMWDFGWSDIMFSCIEKEELVRDVEKHVLNRLIDEITRDFIHLSVAIY
ncbi:hypothetical protein MKW98_030489 [Papaver atlanticum]|uniref:DUF3741 domain-containing protein n=1 Tax=Papaver atlanticum TaxID=357466 RepID=A0AAD4XE81_9MAGN|nr:hypothetical protein MKW98_030489 [Papaver atlanticum]